MPLNSLINRFPQPCYLRRRPILFIWTNVHLIAYLWTWRPAQIVLQRRHSHKRQCPLPRLPHPDRRQWGEAPPHERADAVGASLRVGEQRPWARAVWPVAQWRPPAPGRSSGRGTRVGKGMIAIPPGFGYWHSLSTVPGHGAIAGLLAPGLPGSAHRCDRSRGQD